MAEQDETERWTRFSVNIAHLVGGVALTAVGAGAVVPHIATGEEMALDAAFPKEKVDKVAPSVPIKKSIGKKEVTNTVEISGAGTKYVPDVSVRSQSVDSPPIVAGTEIRGSSYK